MKEKTKNFVFNMCSITLGKDKPEILSDELISILDVFFYNRLRGAVSYDQVKVFYAMYSQDKIIRANKDELQLLDALCLRRLRHPTTVKMLKRVIAKYN